MIHYDADAAARAWDEVTGGIVGAREELAKMKEEFVSVFVTGQPDRKLARELSGSLSAANWSWPWFEQWEAEFDRRNHWPDMWPTTLPDEDELEFFVPQDLLAFRRRAIAPLVPSTALHAAYRNMHLSKAHPSQTWRFVSTDPVEQRIAAEHVAAMPKDGMRELPPFFPGDRTSLMMAEPILPLRQ